MELTINTDGGSRGNPGPAAIGIVVRLGDEVIHEHHESIGIATNNDAEYKACIASLQWLVEQDFSTPPEKVTWKLDSKLVVEQVSKNWKIKDPKIRTYAEECWRLLEQLSLPYSFQYVPRAENAEADALVNQALDAVAA